MRKSILAVQMSSFIGEFSLNKIKVEALISKFYETNKDKKPDIIVLPEVWTVGWYPVCFKDNFDECETICFLSSLAKKYDANIIGGSYIKKDGNTLKNTCPVIDRGGNFVCGYDKIHLYSPDGEAEYVLSGKDPVAVNIEGLTVGLSICYDIRFPELYRSFISPCCTPELFINMSAWPLTRKEQYTYMAKSRAIENQAYFLALSQTGLIKNNVYNAGDSLIAGPMGETLQRLNNDEGYIYQEIDTQKVNDIRRTYPNLLNKKIDNFGFKPVFYTTTKV